MRFWGKILNQKNDYYIVEGVTSSINSDTVKEDWESKGTGINTYSFWVT